MSGTPRTDAAWRDGSYVLIQETSRQLELENAELRQLLKEAVSDLDDLIKHLQVESK